MTNVGVLILIWLRKIYWSGIQHLPKSIVIVIPLAFDGQWGTVFFLRLWWSSLSLARVVIPILVHSALSVNHGLFSLPRPLAPSTKPCIASCAIKPASWWNGQLIEVSFDMHLPEAVHTVAALAEWVRALACTGDRVVLAGFESRCGNFASELWQFRFGGDTNSRRSLLSGAYARGSRISHQSALESVTFVAFTTNSKLPPHCDIGVLPCIITQDNTI